MTLAVGNLAMIPQKSGRIVNVIANIVRGFPGMIHTGAARAGVDVRANIYCSQSLCWTDPLVIISRT
jgi:hypothetical protein